MSDTQPVETGRLKRRRFDFSADTIEAPSETGLYQNCEDDNPQFNLKREGAAAANGGQVNHSGTACNHTGWLDAIRSATRRVSSSVTNTDTKDEIHLASKIDRPPTSQYQYLLQKLEQLEKKQQHHATAAHRLEQRLKSGKRVYGDLLYRYIELERALTQRKQFLERDKEELDREIAQESRHQDRIDALRAELNNLTTSGLNSLVP